MRNLACLLLAALASGVLSGSALAESKGIVVRVATSGAPVSGDAVIVMTAEGGEATEIRLNDAGEPPDVNGQDGTFSGSAWLEGDGFSVSVRLGDTVHDAGRVSWSAEDAKRDLNVTIAGGLVTAEATVSNPSLGSSGAEPEGQPDPDMPRQPPMDGELPPADTNNPGGPPVPGVDGNPSSGAPNGTAPEGGGSIRPPQSLSTSPPPESGSGGLMFAQLFGLLLGIVVIVAMVKWWWQTGGEDFGGPLGLEAQPEPGLLGPGTPSLSDPVSVWSVSAEEISALLGPLLGAVARRRLVCLLTPATLRPPPVFGGPVYLTANTVEFHDALDALFAEATATATGFVVAEQLDADALEGLVRELPAGVGLVVLAVSPTVEVPVPVSCRRDGARWTFALGATTVVADVTPDGLVPVPA